VGIIGNKERGVGRTSSSHNCPTSLADNGSGACGANIFQRVGEFLTPPIQSIRSLPPPTTFTNQDRRCTEIFALMLSVQAQKTIDRAVAGLRLGLSGVPPAFSADFLPIGDAIAADIRYAKLRLWRPHSTQCGMPYLYRRRKSKFNGSKTAVSHNPLPLKPSRTIYTILRSPHRLVRRHRLPREYAGSIGGPNNTLSLRHLPLVQQTPSIRLQSDNRLDRRSNIQSGRRAGLTLTLPRRYVPSFRCLAPSPAADEANRINVCFFAANRMSPLWRLLRKSPMRSRKLRRRSAGPWLPLAPWKRWLSDCACRVNALQRTLTLIQRMGGQRVAASATSLAILRGSADAASVTRTGQPRGPAYRSGRAAGCALRLANSISNALSVMARSLARLGLGQRPGPVTSPS